MSYSLRTEPDAPVIERTQAYALIEQAIAYVRANRARQPSLGAMAAHLDLSESHLQRLFSRWAGVSPKRFLQFLTVEHAKRRMRETGDLLATAYDAGLSGPGRLHDLFVGMEALSPGEFKRAAAGIEIRYGSGPTPFGEALIATTSRGICDLAFTPPETRAGWLARRERDWPAARFVADPGHAAVVLRQVFARDPARAGSGLSLWLAGTNFQVQVWRALLRVPPGGLVSYGDLARLAGRPGAARAVGSAVAANPVAFLIPCHRVLRAGGEFGGYHWGTLRKQAICAWEAAAAGASVAGRRVGDRDDP